MPNTDAKNLALWLRRWHEELALAEAGQLPDLLPAEAPQPATPSGVQPFDSFGVCASDIRLLNPWLVRGLRRPLYFAVLGEWLDGLWLIAPFARFPLPATVGEWNTGRAEADPTKDPLAVLSLWNAHTVPRDVVSQSWFIDILSPEELEVAWEAFRHVTTGKPLPPPLQHRVGPPLHHPADPRHDYLAEEATALRPLGTLAQEHLARIAADPASAPAPVELEGQDHFVQSPLGRFEPALATSGKTSGSLKLKLQVPELGVRVTFRQDAGGTTVAARVTELSSSATSHKLNGGAVIRDGKIVGKFACGRATFKAPALAGRIALRDRKGRPLVVVPEGAA